MQNCSILDSSRQYLCINFSWICSIHDKCLLRTWKCFAERFLFTVHDALLKMIHCEQIEAFNFTIEHHRNGKIQLRFNWYSFEIIALVLVSNIEIGEADKQRTIKKHKSVCTSECWCFDNFECPSSVTMFAIIPTSLCVSDHWPVNTEKNCNLISVFNAWLAVPLWRSSRTWILTLNFSTRVFFRWFHSVHHKMKTRSCSPDYLGPFNLIFITFILFQNLRFSGYCSLIPSHSIPSQADWYSFGVIFELISTFWWRQLLISKLDKSENYPLFTDDFMNKQIKSSTNKHVVYFTRYLVVAYR